MHDIDNAFEKASLNYIKSLYKNVKDDETRIALEMMMGSIKYLIGKMLILEKKLESIENERI